MSGKTPLFPPLYFLFLSFRIWSHNKEAKFNVTFVFVPCFNKMSVHTFVSLWFMGLSVFEKWVFLHLATGEDSKVKELNINLMNRHPQIRNDESQWVLTWCHLLWNLILHYHFILVYLVQLIFCIQHPLLWSGDAEQLHEHGCVSHDLWGKWAAWWWSALPVLL